MHNILDLRDSKSNFLVFSFLDFFLMNSVIREACHLLAVFYVVVLSVYACIHTVAGMLKVVGDVHMNCIRVAFQAKIFP